MSDTITTRPIWETDPDCINPYAIVCNKNDVLNDCDNWDSVEGFCNREDRFGETYEVIADCGNWMVDKYGNIGHKTKLCEIGRDRLKENDWILHLSEKGWFTYEEYLSFKCAYRIACAMAGITPVKQIASYTNDKPIAYNPNRRKCFDERSKTYLMHDSNTGYTKIGKSVNPRQREKTLQSEKPTITMFAVCDMLVEKKLHVKYKNKRIRGEWFDLTQEEIESIITKYNFKTDGEEGLH